MWRSSDLYSRLAQLWILLRSLNIPFVDWHAWSSSKTRSLPTPSRASVNRRSREDLSTSFAPIDRCPVNRALTCAHRKLVSVEHRSFAQRISTMVSIFRIRSLVANVVFAFVPRGRAEPIARRQASATQSLSDQSGARSSEWSTRKIRHSSTVSTSMASATSLHSSGTTQSRSSPSISRVTVATSLSLVCSNILTSFRIELCSSVVVFEYKKRRRSSARFTELLLG